MGITSLPFCAKLKIKNKNKKSRSPLLFQQKLYGSASSFPHPETETKKGAANSTLNTLTLSNEREKERGRRGYPCKEKFLEVCKKGSFPVLLATFSFVPAREDNPHYITIPRTPTPPPLFPPVPLPHFKFLPKETKTKKKQEGVHPTAPLPPARTHATVRLCTLLTCLNLIATTNDRPTGPLDTHRKGRRRETVR